MNPALLHVVGRHAAIASLGVDRSRYEGGAGATIELGMVPLDPEDQRWKDECEERTRKAREDDAISRSQAWRLLAAKRVTRGAVGPPRTA